MGKGNPHKINYGSPLTIIPIISFADKNFKPLGAGLGYKRASLLLPGHPFSVLMEPVREAIISDSSLHFSERTFIRMLTRIMQIVSANGLPTNGKYQKFGIILS
jgi:hypothetical protein